MSGKSGKTGTPSTPPAASSSSSRLNRSSDSHIERPFSPSPPRDTRHTASRPPSLLFGATVPASAHATTSTFGDIAGLPSTPDHYHSIHDGLGRESYFSFGDRRFGDSSGAGRLSLGQVDRAVATAELEIPSLSMVRQNSGSSISTTSSASPPLGSTSILAALATAPSPRPSSDRTPLSSDPRAHDALPPSRTYPSLSSTASRPGSVHFPESVSTPSSISALASSRSMPRLHQPTVVRTVSGKGRAFLPPPARPSRASMPPRTPSDLAEMDRRLSSYAAEGRARERPLSLHVEPRSLTHQLEDQLVYGALGVETEGNDLGPIARAARAGDEAPSRSSKGARTSPSRNALQLATREEEQEAYEGSQPAEEESLHEVDEADKSHLTSREHSVLASPATGASMQLRELEQSDPLAKGKHRAQESLGTEDDLMLHEISDNDVPPPRPLKVATEQSELAILGSGLGPASGPRATSASPSVHPSIPPAATRALPYTPRRGIDLSKYPALSATTAPRSRSASDLDFALTLHAGVTRQPRDGPVSFSGAHVELYLEWMEPRSWRWVPGRKWIPSWDLRMVGKGKEVVVFDEAQAARRREEVASRGLVRGIVRGTVERLPIVWRLADWL